MATGGSYEYRGYTIVINGTGYSGAAVYGRCGFEEVFATETEAEEYVDYLIDGILEEEHIDTD